MSDLVGSARGLPSRVYINVVAQNKLKYGLNFLPCEHVLSFPFGLTVSKDVLWSAPIRLVTKGKQFFPPQFPNGSLRKVSMLGYKH